METNADPLRLWVEPSTASTAAFLCIVVVVCAAWLMAVRRAWPESGIKPVAVTAVCLACLLGLSALAAESEFLAALTASPAIALYLGSSNLIVLAIALSPAGARIAQHTPIHWIIAVQAFRLPLELVLHAWYEQGALPVQMTYQGANFDIVTGVLALVVAPVLPCLSAQARYWSATGFTAVGLGLLLNVAQLAVRSTPSPMRTFLNDPPVLLAFHAPFTWIVPVCVSGALFGHVIAIRWLLRNASLRNGRAAPRPNPA